ncbi:MAG: hypothetical protein Q8P50_00360 [Bacillota bacterium]|nr:hypothetical protein [Bacillota bacterium]
MHETVRKWMADVLKSHSAPVSIALRQRAKFEGWLKFALAAHAEQNGATNVEVEAQLSESGQTRSRSDISFRWNGARYDVELKTPNTNWRMPGVDEKTRPITKNISCIVDDARKLASGDGEPLVAFVIFPVPPGDQRWRECLERIGRELGISLSPEHHADQVNLPISSRHTADVVICCVSVPRAQRADSTGQAAA